MKKKVLILTLAATLTIGAASIAYANGNDNTVTKSNQISSKVSQKASNTNIQDDMLDIMEQNGYGNLAEDVRNGNYEAMDEFMNNISDEDYEKMIQIMKENGYEGMARYMEKIGKDEMIDMHNAMGGAASCHSDNNGNGNSNFGGMMGGGVR